MTLEQQLKHYITNLFELPFEEVWESEVLDEVANGILPKRYYHNTPLDNQLLHTYTYYNDTLHQRNIYPFILFFHNTIIGIGYIDDHHDMDFIYLTDTQTTYFDQRYLLQKGCHYNE